MNFKTLIAVAYYKGYFLFIQNLFIVFLLTQFFWIWMKKHLHCTDVSKTCFLIIFVQYIYTNYNIKGKRLDVLIFVLFAN